MALFVPSGRDQHLRPEGEQSAVGVQGVKVVKSDLVAFLHPSGAEDCGK